MSRHVRALATWIVVAGLAALPACGGGTNSWSLQPEEGDWLVDMTIQTSGCAPTIMRQLDADVVEPTSGTATVVIFLETFYDCPVGEWRLPGTWVAVGTLDVDDQEDRYVCQFDDRWGLGRFSVQDLTIVVTPGGDNFSGSGAFSGDMDGVPCTGTISFFGMRR